MIYLIDNDTDVRELVSYTLNSSGMKTMSFADEESFFEATKNINPSIVLTDIILPGMDGRDVLKKIRKDAKTQKVPVIILTSRSSEYDKVKAFDLGADDYITKPFGIMELTARIKAVMRRCGNSENDNDFEYGGLYICPARRFVSVTGKPVSLTLKEFEILCLLAYNSGVVMTRNKLLPQIWGYEYDGENRTVDVHIKTLRTKLGVCGKYIITVRGVGYKFKSKLG